jgi:hypothetical protein
LQPLFFSSNRKAFEPLLILAKVQMLFQIKCKRTDLAPFAKGANPQNPLRQMADSHMA